MEESRTGYLHRELAGDQLSHRYLTGALAQLRPDDIVLSEEGRDDGARLEAERVWIVDPLDGSSDFADQWSDTWGGACWSVRRWRTRRGSGGRAPLGPHFQHRQQG